MAFRDDHEALRLRNEELEGEVAELRAKQDQCDELRGRVAELERELARARPVPRKPWRPMSAKDRRALALRIAVALGGLLLAAGYLVVLGKPDHGPNSQGESSEAMASAVPTADAGPPPLAADVSFGATVRRTTGRPLAPGDRCEIVASLTRAELYPGVANVRVSCAGQALYELAAAPGFGTTMLSSRASEAPGPAVGSYRYDLELTDEGARDGRPYARLASWDGTGRVWRDRGEPFDVELEIEELSASRQGAPLNALVVGRADTATYRELVRRRGKLTESSDPSLGVGADCLLAVRPNWPHGAYDCRARVRCGTRIIYGSGEREGFRSCVIAPETPPTGEGATLDADLTAGTVAVERTEGLRRLRYVLVLDGAPSLAASSKAPRAASSSRSSRDPFNPR